MRFWEILPGACVWLTLVGLFVLSSQLPMFVAVFILLYDFYWLLKILYLSFHLRFSFLKMKENLKINWLRRLKEGRVGAWEKIYHLVIFPMYLEPHELVRESFLTLLESNYPKDKFLVVLATEERGGREDKETAEKIEKEFRSSFGGFVTTTHPLNIPNELPGKGSNDSWAAREAQKNLVDPRKIPYENILVSVFDIDSRAGADYFGILTYSFLTNEKRHNSSYQPIPLFINNIHKVPIFARLTAFSSTFWQFMQQSRPERLVTFSSHSTPFKALHDVGFWERDLVSEDSRVFFQLLNHTNGDWRVEPLFYPIYMDAVEGPNFWEALRNLYFQQRRWAWGIENLSRFMKDAFHNKLFPFRKKLFWFMNLFGGFYSWASSSFIIFLFGWMPVILGGYDFRNTLISYNLPKVAGFLGNLSMIGILASAFLSVQLLAPRLKGLRRRHYLFYFLEWLLTPIVILVFGSVPALEAQTRIMLGGKMRLGFWKTPKNLR